MFLPIYINIKDFKENYIIHYQEWKDDEFFKNENISVDFEDYLSYYSDLINDTYDDIIQEIKDKDFERLKDISKNIIVSDNVVKKYIEDNFKDDSVKYEDLMQFDNFKMLKNLIESDFIRTYDFDEYAVSHISTFYAYNVDEINNFIFQEQVKLDAYKNLKFSSNNKDIQVRHTAPVVLAILKELKLFAELQKRGFSKASIIDTLFQIVGTNKKNLEQYYDSMLKQDNKMFKTSHIEKSKEFLNSKGY